MSAISFLRDLLADGVPLDAALIAADRFEQRAVASEAARIAERRAKDAERQKAKRDRERHAESRGVTRTSTDSRGPLPHAGASAQVVITTSSSLQSEEVITPVTPNGVTAPRGADKARGTRLPDPWHPDEPEWSRAVDALGCLKAADDELDRFRDYWRAVPGAKGRKADWPATWRNWVRRASETPLRKANDRPHNDAKLAAKNANYARAWTGSERASGRDWEP